MSHGQPNVRTRNFKKLLERLPPHIQQAASEAFHFFLKNPHHEMLNRHDLKDTKKGRHRNGSVSISLVQNYRAIFVLDGSTNVWYWIGSHEDYNNFVGKI